MCMIYVRVEDESPPNAENEQRIFQLVKDLLAVVSRNSSPNYKVMEVEVVDGEIHVVP